MDWILIQCRWTNLTAIARGSPPPARDSMGMAAAGGRLFVFGGQGPEGHRAADSCGLGVRAQFRWHILRLRSPVLACIGRRVACSSLSASILPVSF